VNVTDLQPDSAPGSPSESPDVTPLERTPFQNVLDGAGAALDRADRAEHAFAEQRSGLVEMMVERASADVMLQLAAAAAQRTTQAVSTLLGMQV
jgi:flagellar hook-basal body complex protein FliE